MLSRVFRSPPGIRFRLWMWCLLLFTAQLGARPVVVFFSVKNLHGGATLNQWPVANFFDQTDANVSWHAKKMVLLKNNHLHARCPFETLSGSFMLHLDDEKGEGVYRLEISVKFEEESVDSNGIVVPAFHTVHLHDVPGGSPVATWEIPAQHSLSIKPGASDEKSFEGIIEAPKASAEGKTVQPAITIDLPWIRKAGTDQKPPWWDAPRYQAADLAKVREAALECHSALTARDIERYAEACESKWLWESEATDRPVGELREEAVNLFAKNPTLGPTEARVFRVSTHADSPVIKIEGRQLGYQMGGKRSFSIRYLAKIAGRWRIIY